MNLVEILVRQGHHRADGAAVIDRRGTTTFGTLTEQSEQAAAMLYAHGVRAGDAVLVFQPLSADLLTAITALFRLGAVAMFLEPSAGRQHIAACCQLLPPKALIAVDKAHLLTLTTQSLRRIPIRYSIGCPVPWTYRWKTFSRFAARKKIHLAKSDTPALITFTSGSTGRPKAAVRTHGFLLAQHRVLEKNIKLVPGEIDLTTLPIFSLANLASGVTSVIPDADMRRPGTVNPVPVLRQIRKHRVNRCAASPAFFDCLLQGDDGTLAHLRKILTGGAPVFPRLLNALQEAAPDAMVEAVYGSTEAEPIAHISASDCSSTDHTMMAEGKGLLGGYPVAEIDLRIITANWGESIPPLQQEAFQTMQLGPHQAGEIVVSGPHVLPGYLHGRGDDATKFRVDEQIWHRTGDAGYQDQSGRIWLLGRCIARIDDTKGIIWPFAVECAAMALEGVRRAALISIRGERVLIIEVQRAVDTGLLIENLKRRLHWAKLDQIRSVGLLPVDARHNAKIDYPALRQMLESN